MFHEVQGDTTSRSACFGIGYYRKGATIATNWNLLKALHDLDFVRGNFPDTFACIEA